MFEKGFQYYGALYWQPEAVSTDQKQLQPKTNYPNQENAIRHIEGVSSEGRLISEVQTIPLK